MVFIQPLTVNQKKMVNGPENKNVICSRRTSKIHAHHGDQNQSIRLPLILAATAAAAYILYNPQSSVGETVIGPPIRVVDGDTLIVNGRRVRLQAIDAPELSQTCLTDSGSEVRCGQIARIAMQGYIDEGRGDVKCQGEKPDRYGRLVGVCKVDGQDVGARLVSDGLAVAYRQYGRQYVKLEDEARAAGR